MSRREVAVIRRREQVARQRVILVLFTFVLVMFLVFLGSSIIASGHSQASQEHASFKYYTSIQVSAGDTLWSIAETYCSSEYDNLQDYILEVKELNQLGEDEIHAGQYLTIPYYSQDFQ